MAKASVENSAFVSLRDARALLAEAWQFAPYLAERDIREAWWRRRIHYRASRMHARWHRDAPPPTIAMLRQNAKELRINWEQSSATLTCKYGQVTFYLVELYREHVEKLLPAAQRERVATSAGESTPPQSVALTVPVAPVNPMERPSAEADMTTQLEWAYIQLHITNRVAGLRGKKLLKAACAEVSPKFAPPSPGVFKTAKKRAKARLAKMPPSA
jgi:hypothetical protein